MLWYVTLRYVTLCYGLGADPCFTMALVLRYVNVMLCYTIPHVWLAKGVLTVSLRDALAGKFPRNRHGGNMTAVWH